MTKLTLKIVTQEKQLLEVGEVSSITAPSSEGEVTILPDHIPLVTRLETGIIRYTVDKHEQTVVVSNGFLTISPDNKVTIMANSGVHEREISLEKAEAAVKKAQETIQTSTLSQRELLMAEAALKRALLEERVARRSKRSAI